MNISEIRRRFHLLALVVALLPAVAGLPAEADSGSNGDGQDDSWGEVGGGEDPSPWPWSESHCGEDFDDPLQELERITGHGLQVIAAGAPAGADGPWVPPELTLDVHGTPVAAWIYWIGETRAVGRLAGEPDPSVTLEKLAAGEVSETRELFGEEVGRRHQLFRDEAAPGCRGNGGEVVMRAAVPLELFSEGINEFRLPETDCLNCFNESGIDCSGKDVPIYRTAFGVTLVVVTESASSSGQGEAIGLGGADYATRDRNSKRSECDPAQTRTELACFDFDALEADTEATLSFGVAGLLPRRDEDQRLSTTERTLFGSGAGTVSEDDLVLLETNRLTDETYFYLGRYLSLYQGRVDLRAGDDRACFRIELPEKQDDEKDEQTAVLAHALLVLDREGDAGKDAGDGGCALDPGASSLCAVLELEKKKVAVKGEAGGIVGDVCVAPRGTFEIDGDQFVDGRLRLGEGATYKKKGRASVGSVSPDEDLSAELGDARELAAAAAARSCSQTFGKIHKSLAIEGTAGLNVLCVKEIELNEDESLTLRGEPGSTFVLNLTGKKLKLTDGARIALEGGVRAEDVLINVIGKGGDIELGGGKGGDSCCESVIEGTVLAPDRKIRLKPGLVFGALLSGKEIMIEKGGALRGRPLACLDR